jgi:fumarate hydratase subunit beta
MKYQFNTPLSKEDIMELNVGDEVYLSGIIYTARDKAHMRIMEYRKESKKIPFSLENQVIYHCGPLVKKLDSKWKVVAAGPTTSARMNRAAVPLLQNFDVRALIGKGGMDGKVTEAMREKCVYLAYTGGCAATAAETITSVKDVIWLDLGVPEAVWVLEVEKFGPLLVGIDAHGTSIFSKVEEEVNKHFSDMFP